MTNNKKKVECYLVTLPFCFLLKGNFYPIRGGNLFRNCINKLSKKLILTFYTHIENKRTHYFLSIIFIFAEEMLHSAI